MTCPGNHEWHYNFSNYKARFNMPGDENNNMFFSFDIGPVHFVSISTEFYYYLNYGMQQVIYVGSYFLTRNPYFSWPLNFLKTYDKKTEIFFYVYQTLILLSIECPNLNVSL